MNELQRIYQESPLQAIALAFSALAGIVSLIVAYSVWQNTITKRVEAVETTITSQQMTLQAISDKIDQINDRGITNTQSIVDTNDKVGLIYGLLKK